VLAGQTNGYFVLNDIFRYIKDEEEEPETEEIQPEPTALAGGFQEPAPTAEEPTIKDEAATKETVVQEQAAAQVDKELEEVIRKEEVDTQEAPPPAEVNGTPVPEQAEVTPAEEAPVTAVSAAEEEPKAEATEEAAAGEEAQPEKPKDPVPTPAAAPKASPKPSVPAGPPKPVVPKTWAQLASGRATGALAPAAPASALVAQPKTAQPAQAPSAAAPATAPAAAVAPPPREPSPAEGSQEGSQGGWQTAGADHSRSKSRAQAQIPPSSNGQVRAYVKNVYPTVDANELKAHLTKYGELAYFDVSRQKVCSSKWDSGAVDILTATQNSAFVEFVTRAGFEAAVAANPHKLANENIYVEERRMQGQPGQRGSFRGGAGRGGFDNRGRGSFGGPRGRGGAPAPRGARGGAQAA
jgi:hypothetical protein